MFISAHVNLHLPVETVVEEKIVSHSDTMRLHGVPLPVVVITYITCRQRNDIGEFVSGRVYM